MRQNPQTTFRHTNISDSLNYEAHAYSRAELINRWSRTQLERGLTNRSIVRILPGVYCGVRQARDPVTLGEALNIWAPRGLVSGMHALKLYAPAAPLPKYSRSDLVVRHGDHARVPQWVRLRQSGPVPRGTPNSSVACTTPGFALLDAWRSTAPSARQDLLYSALWSRACTWEDVVSWLPRTKRLPSRGLLVRMISWFADGTTSPLEARARYGVLDAPEFRHLEWQAQLRLGDRRIVADALHRVARVLIEFDGDRYHGDNSARLADHARDVEAAAAGFLTVRFSWHDVTTRPHWCRKKIARTIDSRLP